MRTKNIREKLVQYLPIADEKKVKSIYTLVEDEINAQCNNCDERFIAELDNRKKSLDNGTAKTYTWEETKAAALRWFNIHKQ